MRSTDPTEPAGRRANRATDETREPACTALPASLAGFRVLGRLGEGGMGTVYLVEEGEPLRRQVALKVIRGAVEASDSDLAQRFEAERRALAALGHPNIAQIFAAGSTAGGQLWYTLEYIAGPPVNRYCEERKLGLPQRLELFTAVCRAVHFAHEHGFLHRDLKPGNVLVREVLGRAVPKIIDFGVARALREPGTEEAPPTVVGTPAYMSPEAREPGLAAGGLDARSDVYSLGVMLHELIHGERPRPGRRSPQGDDLEAIAARALAPARADRTPSAAVLAAEVEGWLEGNRPRRGRRRRAWAAGLLALAALVAVVVSRAPGSPGAAIHSLAVVPFEDLSAAGDQGYLASGLAEAVLFDLAQLRDLRVISRTSALHLSASGRPPARMARELGVDALVEGAVVRAGPTVQVTVRLVDLRTDTTRWSGRFEEDLGDLLALERDVAQAIGSALRAELSETDRARLAHAVPPVPAEAVEAHLRGRALWNERTEAGVRAALVEFERAATLAPSWAPAHVGIADCYLLLPPYGGIAPSVAYPRALAAAQKALALDPASAEGHATLGLLLLEHSWDWPGAERAYRRAIELNPGYATAHQWYAELLSRSGRHVEALEQIRQAENLDPLSKIVGAVYGWALTNARRWDEAAAQLDEVLSLDPDFLPAEGFRAVVEIARGRPAAAIPRLERVVAGHPEDSRHLGELGVALARAGRRIEAEALRPALAPPAPAFHRARLELALGRREAALAELERARIEAGVWMLFLRVDPLLDDLRGAPRFVALERQVGFVETAGKPP
ncbi:MAG: protein kinase [Thermoanaerobaculia bacterium]|nr:protein kinase [Thermoanaerobaculia bacterium]